MAPSQTLPDHAPDQNPLKFSPRAVTRLDEEDEECADWDRTLRPFAFDLAPAPNANPRLAAHSRESSIDHKIRLAQQTPQPQTAGSPLSVSASSASAISPRAGAHAASAAVRPQPAIGGVIERPIDPKAAAYGHHRQTSIVHGIQHSRNGSHSSSTSSPLSPQIIAAAGASLSPSFSSADMQAYAAFPPDAESSTTLGSRPPTAVSGNTLLNSPGVPDRASSAPENVAAAHAPPPRKLERIHSGKTRRDHNQQASSSSRHHKDEQKTVGGYAMHVLFTSFIAQAEEKVNDSMTPTSEPEPQVELICGPGADPSFDQLIVALGHIAKQKPKPLIDSMMLWRKSKSDAASNAREQLQQLRQQKVSSPGGPLQRRNTEPLQSTISSDANGGVSSPLASKQEFVVQTERRSSVSTYLLCRVLLEVISQSSLSLITPEMEDKLEEIIFSQLKVADTEQLIDSPLKLANWNIFAQLLGVMSEINFEGVASRFIQDLNRSLQDLGSRGPQSSREEIEGRIELVLGGMKHLRVSLAPQKAWEQSCDFLSALGRLFAKSHGQKIKSSFCQILEMLLLPIAAKATNAHFTHPKWLEVLSSTGPRLAQMFVKPRHWNYAFPLTATMLCVSSPETFSSQWLQLVYSLQHKLKDRATKPLSLQVVSRLVWTYLYRTSDSVASTTRKLDEVLKFVIPTAKRTINSADPAVSEPLIQIIRIIGFKLPEFTFKTIIFPLVNADLFTSNRELKVENLEPDRIVIGIRAFLAVMSDLERGEHGRPPFPQFYPIPQMPERRPGSPAVDGSKGNINSGGLVDAAMDEGLARRVMTSTLSESVKEYYSRFCEILGKITIICDNTFGGQAALDEKFSSPTPKTPIADTFNFSRREEHQTPSEQKQAFYELLHVAVQAIPRCLSPDIPFNSLVNLLCTGTAHVQYNIADSSAQSLKAIARQSHAQQVTMGFSRFIFNFDDRYSTMSDGGMLGATHIENTLRLYVELLHIWIDEIRHKTKEAAGAGGGDPTATDKRAMKLDISSIWAEVDQAEAHGLFFLCSQSRRVRSFAITVLRLIKEFDTALGNNRENGENTTRLIDVLENDYVKVMTFNDEHLSVAERSRLQRGMQDSSNQALIKLCSSEVSYDTTLWFKVFPHLIRVAFDRCPFTITIGRDLICERILQMYKAITFISEPSSRGYYASDPGSARLGRTPTTQPELLVEQWKLYLVFACTTMADSGNAQQPKQPPPPGPQHGRKGSNKSVSTDKIVTARTLFKYLNPLLSASSASVREAVVVAMGSINIHIYRTLLEELQGHVSRCNDEARARIHQRTNSSPRRNRRMDLLRTEITHVYKLTSHFLKDPSVIQDDWVLSNLVTYAKDLKLFLMDGEVQMDWEFAQLRRHYCGLVEEIFEGINRTKDPSRWMTFEARKSSFALMEDWCGFSPNHTQIRHREDIMRQSIIDQQSAGERGTLTAAMEIEKRNLRSAALSAMAALCGGPISVTTESGVALQFDLRRMLGWIESIFTTGNDRMKVTGRRALKNLVVHNQEYPYLLEHCIGRCYLAEATKVLECYFDVITEVVLEYPEYPASFWKLLPLCLFTLGNDQGDIRTNSAKILRALEERQQQQQPGRTSKIQDFDISISDKTKAVYKLAQYKISERLSKQYTELAFYFFSELSLYFKDLEPSAQRNMVAVVLPWVQSIELKVDPNGGPVAQSYMLLANLVEITIKASPALHNEVQALWQALATGPHPGNVRLVMDFIISLCLDRREQNFVNYAKQIVVFLASSNSSPGQKVVEFLLVQITPKAMVPNEKRETLPPPPDISLLPYCADLSEALPVGTKQAGFSTGQLCMILLVDLMVSPVKIVPDNVPVLLQVVAVLWDHYTPLVQEQAREMLVHLIHELVISRLDDANPASASIKEVSEALVDRIRAHDKLVVWNYEDSNGKVDSEDKVPPGMEYLTAVVVSTFEATYPGIKEQWARLSLTWATSCPVRHLACRSFQVFRCIQTSIDKYMLGDMLARLSNTVADDDPEIQTFAMEILATLKTLIASIDAEYLVTLPQLFWTACACLESINEREFLGAIEMLNEYLDKLDFSSANIRRLLLDGRPPKWDGHFEGLQPLLYKGLRSSVCHDATLATLDRLVVLPSDPLIGDDSRIFFSVLANLPRFLNAMDHPRPLSEPVATSAELLLGLAIAQGHSPVALVLKGFLSGNYQIATDFIHAVFSALKESFSPQLDFRMVTMLMGFLTNRTPWVKTKTLRSLEVIISEIDMKRPDIAGSDLLSPLLRLLQTEYCVDALGVLDHIMHMSGAPMDKEHDKRHLRMSMTRPTTKAVRREYERTQSLFGIPEESGWAIPMPARKTDSTRANIHAAFYMCHSSEGVFADATPTPEVEFHTDEFPYGYFPTDRTETMMSDDPRADGTANDLATRLDSLDDYFDDVSHSPPSDGRSSRTITEFHPDAYDLGAHQLYDDHVLPILQASSTGSSFSGSFVDRTPTQTPLSSSARDTAVGGGGHTNTMTPGAFNFGQDTAASSRPTLHSRSITSPSASASYQPQLADLASDDELFSDGDDNATGPGDGSFFLENMIIRPLATQPPRTRVRRPTGGTRSRDERQMLIMQQQQDGGALGSPPQVPKLPSSYLQKGPSPPHSDML